VRRLAPALLSLLWTVTGCNPSGAAAPCPAAGVARFQFTGVLTEAACTSGGPIGGVNALYPSPISFSAEISYTPGGVGAAICPDKSRADPMVGTHSGAGGDRLDVSLQTSGFVSACNLCAAVFVQQIVGDLQRDQGGTPIGFTGTLTDSFALDTTVAGADCTPCVTPCHGTYALTTAPLATP
jgi:hypothetical protein